jgi:hypothetical protein
MPTTPRLKIVVRAHVRSVDESLDQQLLLA